MIQEKNQKLRYRLTDTIQSEKQSIKQNEIDEKSLRNLQDNFQRSNLTYQKDQKERNKTLRKKILFLIKIIYIEGVKHDDLIICTGLFTPITAILANFSYSIQYNYSHHAIY